MSLDALNSKWCKAIAGTLGLAPDQMVLGEGNASSPPVLLVGEAPGAQETLQRRPFVGQAGKNLDGFLRAIQLPRESIYITNLVKVRPTKVGASGRLSNRPPTKHEINSFLPWLLEECGLVAPKLIVTLGNSALKALYAPQAVIGGVHGQLLTTPSGSPLFALYHPAAVIYNRALQDTYRSDLEALSELVKHLSDH